jgi:glutamate dehydrogenase/leucine dehydrogenase
MNEIGAVFDHETLEVFHDDATGVIGVIAIHSTAIGPAMGGLRLRAYASLDDAIVDGLRLARAMSLKSAAAGLELGGGKAVVLDDGGWNSPAVRTERMAAVGRHVDALQGRYITAEDVGTTPRDMEDIARSTRLLAQAKATNRTPWAAAIEYAEACIARAAGVLEDRSAA